jgi:hypothetical protein
LTKLYRKFVFLKHVRIIPQWLLKSDNAPHFRSQSGAAKPLFLSEQYFSIHWFGFIAEPDNVRLLGSAISASCKTLHPKIFSLKKQETHSKPYSGNISEITQNLYKFLVVDIFTSSWYDYSY